MKSHFFILSRLRSLLKGFRLLCEVACRQGRLLFFQETRPDQNQERLFRGEMVSCVQRRDCALLRAKTSALLRRKTCAVLRARTCALLRANTKEAAFGRLHKGGRPSAAPLCGFLCIGSEQSTCPSSQHSTCLASQQGRCLGSQQGTCLASQH